VLIREACNPLRTFVLADFPTFGHTACWLWGRFYWPECENFKLDRCVRPILPVHGHQAVVRSGLGQWQWSTMGFWAFLFSQVHACAVWRFTKPIAVPGFESSKAPGVIQISSPLALEAYSDFNLTVQCSAQQLSWIWLQVKRGLKGCKKCDTSYERNETQFSKLSWSQKQADLWDPMSIWVGLSTEFGTPSIPRWKRATFAEVIDTFDGWALLSGLEAQT